MSSAFDQPRYDDRFAAAATNPAGDGSGPNRCELRRVSGLCSSAPAGCRTPGPGYGRAHRLGTMWSARFLYGEPVCVASMQSVRRERSRDVETTYRFDSAGREQRLRVRGRTPPVMPAPSSPAYDLLARNWHYGQAGNGDLLRTRIERPVTPVYRVHEHVVTARWASVYGNDWAFLQKKAPALVLFAPVQPLVLQWRQRGIRRSNE